jgi:hypothetical protein
MQFDFALGQGSREFKNRRAVSYIED